MRIWSRMNSCICFKWLLILITLLNLDNRHCHMKRCPLYLHQTTLFCSVQRANRDISTFFCFLAVIRQRNLTPGYGRDCSCLPSRIHVWTQSFMVRHETDKKKNISRSRKKTCRAYADIIAPNDTAHPQYSKQKWQL